ncbi:DNA methyltransferase [Enterococcus casseliflavus]
MSLENEQLSFDSEQRENKRVTVLGMEFENDDARREYFREELRKKLPELRKIEGFPIGNDEDIIELSDPPFYTVCPNPFINRFINEWKTEDVEEYSKEPLAVDISFGKNTPIYNAHTYHTKVPYKAIMSYLLHYTKPGDIVYDAFSGTGMTGVASSLMNNKEELLEIKPDITDNDIGVRHAFLSDLAPVGSVISEVYNSSVDSELLVSELTKLLADSKKDLGWVYKTEVNNVEYDINYTVWSDVFSCPNCLTEFIYYEEAFDIEENKLHSDFSCPNCGMLLNKQKSDKVMSEYFDAVVGKKLKVLKQKPVLISYGFGRNKGIANFK